MDLDAETRFDSGEALRRRQLGGGGFEIDNEGDDLRRDLVTASGAARPGQQASKPGRGDRVLSLVKVGRDTPKVAATSLMGIPSALWRRTIS
jgi:hypothetical protein